MPQSSLEKAWYLLRRTASKTTNEILQNPRLRNPRKLLPELTRLIQSGLSELSQLSYLAETEEDVLRAQIASAITSINYPTSGIQDHYIDKEKLNGEQLPAMHLLLMPDASFTYNPGIASYPNISRELGNGRNSYARIIESQGPEDTIGVVIPPTYNERNLQLYFSQKYGVTDVEAIPADHSHIAVMDQDSSSHFLNYGYCGHLGLFEQGIDQTREQDTLFAQGALFFDGTQMSIIDQQRALDLSLNSLEMHQHLVGINWRLTQENYTNVVSNPGGNIPNLFNGIGFYYIGENKIPFTINTFDLDQKSLLLLQKRNPTLRDIAVMVDTVGKTLEADNWEIAGLDYRGGGTVFSPNGLDHRFSLSIGPSDMTARTDAILIHQAK